MRKLNEVVRKTLEVAREKTIVNAWQLLQTAVLMFEQEQYTMACFSAMTAIEEVGKLFILRLVQGDEFSLGFELDPPPELNVRQLNKFLREHSDKALEAAVWSLYINAGADRRHGVNPISGMHRTSGVVLLARSGRWMGTRNACLYTDIDFASNSTTSPSDFITREHAYYFICMGFEVLAEQAESGLGSASENRDANKGFQFWQERLGDLEEFMERWTDTVDLDRLDFLTNPEPLQEEAERCEAKEAKKKEKARNFVIYRKHRKGDKGDIQVASVPPIVDGTPDEVGSA